MNSSPAKKQSDIHYQDIIVELYCTPTCQFCKLAKEFFDKRGIAYHEFRVEFNQISWLKMEDRSQRSTVPQIFINGYHVGGYEDLLDLDRNRQIEKLF